MLLILLVSSRFTDVADLKVHQVTAEETRITADPKALIFGRGGDSVGLDPAVSNRWGII